MAWRFRKSKKIGLVRVTASKTGVSLSAGATGARVSVNSKGEVRRAVGIPGSGAYSTERVGGGATGRSGATTRYELQVQDATGGSRRLFEGDTNVECARVVQLDLQPPQAAQVTGITGQPTSVEPRGIRDCVLMPSDDGHYYVALLIDPQDNPSMFGRKSLLRTADATPRAVPLGRLTVKDSRRFAELFAGRPIRAVIFIDAEERSSDGLQVRFRRDLIDPTQSDANGDGG